MFYGHDPPINTTYETIDAVLARADEHHLGVFTFADLAAGRKVTVPERPAALGR
jgi:hypothetical protein